jgi:hypothetical protein
MDFPSIWKRALDASRSVFRGVKRATDPVRRALTAADIWIQDHHVAVVTGVLSVLTPSVGLLLWTHWDEVVEVAKQLAPVLSVLTVTGGAIASTIKWLRKRRNARLAAKMQVIELPAARSGTKTEQAMQGSAAASALASAAGGAHDAA